MDLALLPESAEVAATARSMLARHAATPGPAPNRAPGPAPGQTRPVGPAGAAGQGLPAGAAGQGPAAGAGDPLWRAVVAAGWLDILADSDLDYPRLEAAIGLLREVGRALPDAAIQTGLAARWLSAALPGLAGWRDHLAGQPDRIVALSWPLGVPRQLPLRLTRRRGGYRLDGDLGLVREAAVAADLLALADLDGQPMLAVLPLDAEGAQVTRADAVGGLRQARVQADGLLLAGDEVSPAPAAGQKARADALLLILDAAELTGCAEMALEMTVHHARTRRQFGRPLGAFQAVRHRIADMSSDVAQSRWLLYRAADRLARAQDPAAAVTEAHALALWNSVALERVISSAHQVHGGVGFIRDHPLHRYFGRQKASMFCWGQSADYAAFVLASLFPAQELAFYGN